jgi:DNA-binding NarL/FixJ family response regulator
MEKPLSKKEQKELDAEQKKKIIQVEHEFRQSKELTLKEHFKDTKELSKRNSAIMTALDDGYTQGEVARYLGLSSAMVSKVFRDVK